MISDWAMWGCWALFIIVLSGGALIAMRSGADIADQREKFIREHKCKVVEFSSEAFSTRPIFLCDDGNKYTYERMLD